MRVLPDKLARQRRTGTRAHARSHTNTHRITGAFKIQEHLADEHAPTLLRVAVLHLRQPALYRRLVVLPTEQEFRRVSPLHILQHPYPILHRGDAVRGQIVSLLTGSYFKRGGTFGPIDPGIRVSYYPLFVFFLSAVL